MKEFKKFLIRELILTALVSFIAIIFFRTFLNDYYLLVFWVIVAVVAILTALFHYSVIQVKEKGATKFSTRFMMISGIKMIIYLVLIVSYVFSNPLKATPFLISFFILYLIYTAFEVILIIRYLKS